MVTRRQHYVWRKYLRAWATDEKIWCLRDGKVFQASLMKVAQERDFYKIHNLTPEEIKFLNDFCSPQPEPLRTTNLRWVRVFTRLFDLERSLIARGIDREAIAQQVDEAAIEYEEGIQGEIEQSAINQLDALLRRDASFYNRVKEKVNFIHYICVQYMRTKKRKWRALEGPGRITAVNPENVWNTLAHIVATSLGQSLIAGAYQLYFLKADGDEVFVTSDQPVINIRSTFTSITEAPKELDLYYPISPKLAVLIASEPPEDSVLSNREVREYNRHMMLQSHAMLFAHQKSVFDAFNKPA